MLCAHPVPGPKMRPALLGAGHVLRSPLQIQTEVQRGGSRFGLSLSLPHTTGNTGNTGVMGLALCETPCRRHCEPLAGLLVSESASPGVPPRQTPDSLQGFHLGASVSPNTVGYDFLPLRAVGPHT